MAKTYNFITYHDTTIDKVGAIEDDHLGVEDMIKSKPGWVIKGYVSAETAKDAVTYTEQVLMLAPMKPKRR